MAIFDPRYPIPDQDALTERKLARALAREALRLDIAEASLKAIRQNIDSLAMIARTGRIMDSESGPGHGDARACVAAHLALHKIAMDCAPETRGTDCPQFDVQVNVLTDERARELLDQMQSGGDIRAQLLRADSPIEIEPRDVRPF